jgi:hypothetical protein
MSEVKVYVINFFGQNVNLAALHQYLSDSADILGFWNYIPLVYCVKTRLSAHDLSAKLVPFFPSGFIVAEIDVKNLNGRLISPDAWKWFYEPAREKLAPFPLPQQSTSYYQGLMGLLPKP